MRIKLNHVELVSQRIARDLLSSKLVRFTEGMDFVVEVAKEILAKNIKWELEIDFEVSEIIDENEEEIEFQRADRKQLFWLIKRRISNEDGFILDKEERYNDLAHKILDELYERDLIFFTVSETRIKSQIVRSIFEFGRSQDEIEDKVKEKISSLKKDIKKGSTEYEILFEKYFEEEMAKIGA